MIHAMSHGGRKLAVKIEKEVNSNENTPQHPYHPHRRYHLLIRRQGRQARL